MAASDWKLSVMMGHGSVKRALQLWRRCDEIGLDVVGAADSQNLMREIYVCLTAVALSTKRARIMSYATNPVTRHPSVTAGAFVAMNELAPGRLMMGIGTGDSALWSMGRKVATIAETRAYVQAVKALCAGEAIEWDGQRFKPAWAYFEPFDLPVYVMCSGPKILRMAAEVADGAVVHMGFAPEDIAYVRGIVDDGRRAVGKDPKTFDLWWNTRVVFDRSYDAAAARTLGWMPRWLTMGSMDGKGIPDAYKEKLKQLNADTHSLAAVYKTKNREQIVVERAKELGLYDWLMARSPRLFGTPDDVAGRMNELGRSLGLKQWILFLIGNDGQNVSGTHAERFTLLEQLTKDVKPKLRA